MIARVLPEEVTEERIRTLIRSAFELMEGNYISDGVCTGCNKAKQVHVQIPDLQGTIRVLTEWIEQGFGKPGTAQAESGDVVLVVERRWPVAKDPGSDELRAASPPGGVPPK